MPQLRNTKWKWIRKTKLQMWSPNTTTREKDDSHGFPFCTPLGTISSLSDNFLSCLTDWFLLPLSISHPFGLFLFKRFVLKNHKSNVLTTVSDTIWRYIMKNQYLSTLNPIPNCFIISEYRWFVCFFTKKVTSMILHTYYSLTSPPPLLIYLSGTNHPSQ